jgi:hypothetical protein
MNIPESWRALLDHLKKLRDEKSAPRHDHKRRHARRGPSPIVQTFARAEMRRRQHKG